MTAFARITVEQADIQLDGVIRNLAEGGMLFESHVALEAGTAIRVDLPLADGAILQADAEIAWMQGNAGRDGAAAMGVRFVALYDDGRALLRRAIASQQAGTAPPPPPAVPPPPRFTPPPPAPAAPAQAAPLPVIGGPLAAPVDLRLMPPAGSHGASAARPLALPVGIRPKAFQFPPLEGKSTKRMIGIDLGTAFSCAAYVKNGAAVMIPGDKGKQSFPSAVFVRGDQTILGSNARERMETNPANVIHSWKRLMGRRYESTSVRDAFQSAS